MLLFWWIEDCLKFFFERLFDVDGDVVGFDIKVWVVVILEFEFFFIIFWGLELGILMIFIFFFDVLFVWNWGVCLFIGLILFVVWIMLYINWLNYLGCF